MKRKDILLILIPTFIVVLLWVVFSVYHSYINSTIPKDVNMQILYIEPDFDLKTVEGLKKRQLVNPIYTIESQNEEDLTTDTNQAQTEDTPTPTPTITNSNPSSTSATQQSLEDQENSQ